MITYQVTRSNVQLIISHIYFSVTIARFDLSGKFGCNQKKQNRTLNELQTPFTKYVFIESSKSNVRVLEQGDNGELHRITKFWESRPDWLKWWRNCCYAYHVQLWKIERNMPIYGLFSPEFATCPTTVEWYSMLPEGQWHMRCVKPIKANPTKSEQDMVEV